MRGWPRWTKFATLAVTVMLLLLVFDVAANGIHSRSRAVYVTVEAVGMLIVLLGVAIEVLKSRRS